MGSSRRKEDEESSEDGSEDGSEAGSEDEDTDSGESCEQHGRVFEALKAIDSALMKPGYVHFRAGRAFRKCATKGPDGTRTVDLDGARAMTKVIAAKLSLPDWLFQDVEHLFERFDFDGSGSLSRDQAVKMFRTGLQQRRVELGGMKRPIDVPSISLDEAGYTVVRELGRGGQGVMYLCTSTKKKAQSDWMCGCSAGPEEQGGERYCVKFYDKENANACDMDELIAEYALMKDMKNRYVAKTFEVFQDRSYYYLVNEPYFGGDFTKLAKNAHEKSVAMTENWWRGIFRQTLEGLTYLHSKAIIHCDIKEANIMIAANDTFLAPVPVLIDFGLSTPFGSMHDENDVKDGIGSPSGTPGYIPPETWETEVWYPQGDIFSLGIVFFQMMVARIPSDHTDIEGVLQEGNDEQTLYRNAKSMPLPWDKFPADWPLLRSLIEQMTARERSQRLRGPGALQHQWFHSDSDASLPPTTVRDLVYNSEAHTTREGVVTQLVVMNNLEGLRRLVLAAQPLRAPTGGVNAVAAAQLLEDAGLESHLCKDFLKACQGPTGHGVLLQTLQDAENTQRRYSEQLVRDLFDELDVDGSGSLSSQELFALLDGDAFQCPYDDLDELMDAMDADEDGVVSWAEFLKVALEDGRIARRSDVRMGYAKPSRCSIM